MNKQTPQKLNENSSSNSTNELKVNILDADILGPKDPRTQALERDRPYEDCTYKTISYGNKNPNSQFPQK